MRHQPIVSGTWFLMAAAAAGLAGGRVAYSANGPASRPFDGHRGKAAGATSRAAATLPAGSQPLLDMDHIRRLIEQLDDRDYVVAADAAAQIKLLARRGVPVWEGLRRGDTSSAAQLLTWLREHPGDIHHPSPLRFDWERMDLFRTDERTGRVAVMGNAELINYAGLAREMLRDGDPYGYWAVLDVAMTAMDTLDKGADHVTFAYVLPYLDRHLDQHLVMQSLKQWKGYWSTPLTEPRPYVHPVYRDFPLEPTQPRSPWTISTDLLLNDLDKYRARLREMGLWQSPPWELRFTERTSSEDLIEALRTEAFPVRQHIYRLLRDRMGDQTAREQIEAEIERDHPQARLLRRLLEQTKLLLYADSLRRAWPDEITEQCPLTLADLTSSVPRRQSEGLYVLIRTLLYWPDRAWANRTAVKLFEATGKGSTEQSVAILATVDDAYGVGKLLATYRQGDLPDAVFNQLHQWARNASEPFRNECADRDLAPIMLNLTAASQPAVNIQQADWGNVLRMAYDLVWWEQNRSKVAWNDKTNRLEVPAEELSHPTEDQVLQVYKNRADYIRESMQRLRGARSPRHAGPDLPAQTQPDD